MIQKLNRRSLFRAIAGLFGMAVVKPSSDPLKRLMAEYRVEDSYHSDVFPKSVFRDQTVDFNKLGEYMRGYKSPPGLIDLLDARWKNGCPHPLVQNKTQDKPTG